jgi:hypothetical protein
MNPDFRLACDTQPRGERLNELLMGCAAALPGKMPISIQLQSDNVHRA